MSIKNVFKIPSDMQVSTIHKTKFNGDLTVVKYMGYNNILVRFNDTSYETFAEAGDIRKGNVRDKFIPSIQGAGYLGGDYYKSDDKGFELICYDAWCNMLKRCYSGRDIDKTYADCEVCEEWQNFQHFAEWFHDNHPNDGGKWHMDKDIKVKGNRLYSPSTCLFVTATDNVMEMIERVQMKMSTVISPDGCEFDILNVTHFCRDNGLSQSAMSCLINGKAKTHKGWTLKRVIK